MSYFTRLKTKLQNLKSGLLRKTKKNKDGSNSEIILSQNQKQTNKILIIGIRIVSIIGFMFLIQQEYISFGFKIKNKSIDLPTFYLRVLISVIVVASVLYLLKHDQKLPSSVVKFLLALLVMLRIHEFGQIYVDQTKLNRIFLASNQQVIETLDDTISFIREDRVEQIKQVAWDHKRMMDELPGVRKKASRIETFVREPLNQVRAKALINHINRFKELNLMEKSYYDSLKLFNLSKFNLSKDSTGKLNQIKQQLDNLDNLLENEGEPTIGQATLDFAFLPEFLFQNEKFSDSEWSSDTEASDSEWSSDIEASDVYDSYDLESDDEMYERFQPQKEAKIKVRSEN